MKLVSEKCLMINGTPYRLLWLVRDGTRCQTWRVKPLFVVKPDHDLAIYDRDSMSYLHTQYAA